MTNPTTTAPVDLDVDASSGSRCNPTISNQKGNTMMPDTNDTAPSELVPVDLDQPSPAVAHWAGISALDVDIDHDFDVSKVIPFERPPWSEPDRDDVTASVKHSCFNSEFVDVVTSAHAGVKHKGGVLEQASVRVRAKMHGDGLRAVGLTLRRSIKVGEWVEFGSNLTVDEALELADVLRAAVALHTEAPC